MAEVSDSILDTTKRLLGVDPESTDFDLEIVTHINSTFFTLQQLGVGPDAGFMIFDNTATWADFIGMEQIMAVKSYMGLKVRLLFDPPATGPAIQAMERHVEQLEWRLNIQQENAKHGGYYTTGSGDATVWVAEAGVFPEGSEDGDVGFDPVTGNLWRDI